jgi:hypothetical protein
MLCAENPGCRTAEELLSDWQLQVQRERQITAALAGALGLSVQEVDRLDYLIDPDTAPDGTVQGYFIYFWDGSDRDVLARIPGLVNGRWVRIDPVL